MIYTAKDAYKAMVKAIRKTNGADKGRVNKCINVNIIQIKKNVAAGMSRFITEPCKCETEISMVKAELKRRGFSIEEDIDFIHEVIWWKYFK